VICGITAYISVRWLVRYFETKRLEPFAVYSLVVGLISFVHFVQ
jgi:undecaprenyl-diphosphatase